LSITKYKTREVLIHFKELIDLNMIFIYFDPDIWGTVSDWFMVIVTIVTAFYLYKTLQSQKNVQETQNKLFEIETIRFRESIKPN
jgi:hypothetical protein